MEGPQSTYQKTEFNMVRLATCRSRRWCLSTAADYIVAKYPEQTPGEAELLRELALILEGGRGIITWVDGAILKFEKWGE